MKLLFLIAVPLTCGAATITEDFSTEPTRWRTQGNASLFSWNTNAHALDAIWDSRESNSYFYRPLGTVLTRHDDFRFEFAVTLHDIEIGVTPSRPYTFEVAVGLINLRSATATNFFRGQLSGTRNVLEFNYFPAYSSFGATVAATVVSSNNIFAYSHNFPLEMTVGDLFHVRMAYTASNSTLATTITRNGESFGPIQEVRLGPSFTDFRVDAFAISSYSDERADGSILAHGSVDDIALVYPDPPPTQLAGRLADGRFDARFSTWTNWFYSLEQTANLETWTAVSPLVPGTGGEMILSHEEPSSLGFYRVRAERP